MDERLVPLLQLVAPAISFGLVLLFGRPTIALLRKVGAVQRVRDDGPQRHLQKEGTPTMGGVLIIGAAVVAALVGGLAERLWSDVRGWLDALPGLVFGITLAYGGIGLLDDWLKIRRGRSLGLRARQKLALQVAGAIALYLAIVWLARSEIGELVQVSPRRVIALFAVGGVVSTLAIVATANAVNLADGLDGLAAGLCTIAFVALAVIAMARPIGLVVTTPALSLAGACLGFLWFNRHPARVFMGDVGSLALGAAVAAMASMLGIWILIGVCLVPFIEMLSVIIQVISFKTTGKRVFRMSPIHHHFELSGWSEQRVVWTFWGVGAAAAVVMVWACLR